MEKVRLKEDPYCVGTVIRFMDNMTLVEFDKVGPLRVCWLDNSLLESIEDPRKNAAPRDAHDGYPLSPGEKTLVVGGIVIVLIVIPACLGIFLRLLLS